MNSSEGPLSKSLSSGLSFFLGLPVSPHSADATSHKTPYARAYASKRTGRAKGGRRCPSELLELVLEGQKGLSSDARHAVPAGAAP